MDFHEARTILGVSADTDRDGLARAYRRRARATHPDVSADPDAAAHFAAVTAAYRVLSDQPTVEAHVLVTPPTPGPSSTAPRARARLDDFLVAVGPVRVQPSRRPR